MTLGASVDWHSGVGGLAVKGFDDGDVVIAERGGGGIVLSPDQVSRFQTISKLVLSSDESVTWGLGENCTGDESGLHYEPEDDSYVLYGANGQFELDESQVSRLRDILSR